MFFGLNVQIPYIYYKLNEGVDACLSFSFLDSRNILAEASAAELLPRSLLGIMRIRRISTMKRRMLSVLLSVLLVIATICVSSMPSRAVEPEDEVTQEETMQEEMVTAEVLSNSEVTATGEATEELTEEVTGVTTEELADERVATSVLENSEMVATEEAAEDGTAQNKATEGNEKSSGNITLTETIAVEENSASQTDADMKTAGDTEDNEVSAENGSADKVQTDDKVAEEATEDVTEEITEVMLDGAEGYEDNVSFYIGKPEKESVSDEGKKEYTVYLQVDNDYEADVYLSCLRGYVTDEKGNKYNVPTFVKRGVSSFNHDEIDITNDINGYWGYKNESVLTDESVSIPTRFKFGEGAERFYVSCIVPSELKGNFSIHIYVEAVKLDDASGKVAALHSDSKTYYEYDCVTNVENSNYCISESGSGDLSNVDVDVYHDGNDLIMGTEANFYIKISNKNDFDIKLGQLTSRWARENSDYEYDGKNHYDLNLPHKSFEITDPDGKSMINHYCDNDFGFSLIIAPEGRFVIKAGETVTYRAKCTVTSDDSGKIQPIDFDIWLAKDVLVSKDSCSYNYVFKPIDESTPTISIDKEDESVPNLKLDDEAYDKLIDSAFTEAEIKSGKHLKVDLIIAAVSEADVEQSELETIKAAAKKRKIAVILDMNLVKLIDGIVSGNINQLDKEITMTIDIPKAFLADNRKFSIIRLHDGIAEELPDLDDNPNTVTFTTGKFSLYTLIYDDVEEGTVEPPKNDAPDAAITPVIDANKTQQASSPNTGDTAPIAVVFVLMLISAFLAVVSVKHIKKNK